MRILSVCNYLVIGGGQRSMFNFMLGTPEHEHFVAHFSAFCGYSINKEWLDILNNKKISHYEIIPSQFETIIQKINPDIVLYHWWENVFIPQSFFSDFNRKYKIIAVIHDNKIIPSIFDNYILTSKFSYNFQKHISSFKKSEVIYNGVDTKMFDLPRKYSEKCVIGRVTTLTKAKISIDYIDFINVFNASNVHFMIGGEGEQFEILEKRIQFLNLNDKVTLLGHIPLEEVSLILNSFDFSCYLTSSHIEVHSLNLIEMACCGLPIVAEEKGSLPEQIIHGETGFISNDKRLIKHYCEILVKDIKLRELMSKKAKKFGNQFTTERQCKQYNEFLLSCLKERIEVKEKESKVSIIIVNYKTYNLTKKCLESIKKYTKYSNYEVIVVDNNSNDESLEYLKTLDWIKLIERTAEEIAKDEKEVNTGGDSQQHANGLHRGIRETDAEYILTLDTDTCILKEEWLQKMVEFCKNDEKIAIVGCYENQQSFLFSKYIHSFCALYKRKIIIDNNLTFHWCGDGDGFIRDKLLDVGQAIYLQVQKLGHKVKVWEELKKYVYHLWGGTRLFNYERGLKREHPKTRQKISIDHYLHDWEIKKMKEERDYFINGLYLSDKEVIFKEKVQIKKVKCTALWTRIEIAPNGDVLPCCHIGEVLGNINKIPIRDIWNNKKYEELRNEMLIYGKTRFCPEWCSEFRKADISHNVLIKEEENFNKEAYIRERKIRTIVIADNYKCNLHCNMCIVHNYNKDICLSFEIYKDIESYLQDLDLLYFSAGSKSGGEFVLFLREDVKRLIQKAYQYSNIKLACVTNATLITQKLAEELFSNLAWSFVMVSIDGITKEVYESIRGQNTWEKFKEGLDNILKQKTINKNLKVKGNFVIQKRNICQIRDYYNFCLQHGIEPMFNFAEHSNPDIVVMSNKTHKEKQDWLFSILK